jgi:hypothetical protein
MTDKARRVIGPLLILVGLWLCVELWHGKLGGVVSIGPFLIIAGGLWFASDLADPK